MATQTGSPLTVRRVQRRVLPASGGEDVCKDNRDNAALALITPSIKAALQTLKRSVLQQIKGTGSKQHLVNLRSIAAAGVLLTRLKAAAAAG